MKLLNLFGINTKKKEVEKEYEDEGDILGFEEYSGMRVEVTTVDGGLLFVAKLQGIRGSSGELHQYSEAEVSQNQNDEPIHAKIRGYNDEDRKAIYLEGDITPLEKHIWKVEGLDVTRISNDRAFFRLNTDLEATSTMFGGLTSGERPCRLLDISVGGARIGSEFRYYKNDKFLLKVQLLEDRPESAIFCKVLRVIEKGESKFEYGCQFIELNEADQEKITQNIFAAQIAERRKKRGDF